MLLRRREADLKQVKASQGKLKSQLSDLLALFTHTLNVKLRYENIIKTLLYNSDKKLVDKRTIRDIIISTKPEKQVQISTKKRQDNKNLDVKSIRLSKSP